MSNAFDDLPAGNAFDDLSQPATAKDRIEAHQAAVFRGAAYVLGAIPDVIPNLYNLGKAELGTGYSLATGEAPPKALEAGDASPVSAWLAKKMNEVKVPEGISWDSEDRRLLPTIVDRPDDPASRYIAAASGTLPALASGGSLPNAVKGLIPAVAGASAGQYVSDAKPFKSETANATSSVVANVLADALTRAAGRGISGIAQPFTAGGQKTIVGRALNAAAEDPTAATQNLGNVPQYIPGSTPTSGVASKDPGLMSLEAGLKNEAENKPLFNEVLKRNNATRQAALSGAAQDETAIATAKAARDAAGEKARAGSVDIASTLGVKVDTKPVLDKIDAMLASPSNQGSSTQAVLAEARKAIAAHDDPLALYAIRKEDIAPAIAGSSTFRSTSIDKYGASRLIDVQKVLDGAIEKAAPGYQTYMSDYRTASQPINQMQILQELQKRAANAAPDVSGTDILNQGKWSRAVDKAQAEGDLAKLSPQQQSLVRAMIADLDREASAGSAVERTAGSNTAFNLSSHQLLGKLLGQKVGDSAIGKTVGRVIDWAYHAPDEQMREILAHSMLRPDQARQLMLRAQQNKPMDMQTVMAQRALQNLVNVPQPQQ